MYPQLEALGYKFCLGIAAPLIVFSSLPNGKSLTNGMVLELSKIKDSLGVPNKFLYIWCCQFLNQDEDTSKNSLTKMSKCLKSLKLKEKSLKKSSDALGKDKLSKFLYENYNMYPIKKQQQKHSQIKSMKSKLTKEINRCKSLKKQNEHIQNLYRNNIRNMMSIRHKLLYARQQLAKKAMHESKLIKSNIVLKNSTTVAVAKIRNIEQNLQNEKVRLRYSKNVLRTEKKRLNEKAKYWENIAQKTRYSNERLQQTHEIKVKELENQVSQLKKELNSKKVELRNSQDELHFMIDNSIEERCVDLTIPAPNGKYTFSPETDKCIMELLDANVAYEKVSSVMTSVMKLCSVQIKNNILPKKDYVSSISTTKLLVSQIHVASVCSNHESQTLYTDETRKNGQSYGVFVTTTDEKQPYLLGLRQMSNKAAKTQLDVFKEILSDVEQRYNQLKPDDPIDKLSFKILKNIKCTMSDRAATQISFNQLLETYRSTMLKEHIENFDHLPEEDQMILSKMFNFFCGLHLMVNIADLMNSVFKDIESDPPEDIQQTETSIKGESSVLNAVRIISKALASGADEKNGCYLEFKTYLQRNNIIKYEIKPFLGNRFNVVFHNAGAIYHLHVHIQQFLKNVKGEGNPSKLNRLLKAVLSCVTNTSIMTGCRALGIFNKFITAPLWKVLETDLHILEMNNVYQNLVQFLQEIAGDISQVKLFMTGELKAFPSTDIKKDDIWASLVRESNDEKCAAYLIQMCSATSKVLQQKVKDHLIDGNHSKYDEQLNSSMNSVLPHNKLPEWVFGQLDWVLKHRPNASRLANEAHIVYHVNKTGEWLNQQNENQIQQLISMSKSKIKQLKVTEKQRLAELKDELERISREKEQRAERINLKRSNEKKDLVENVLKCGLWDSPQKVDDELAKIKFLKNKREAIKLQIKFRQLVLEQSGEKTLFQTSQVKNKQISIEQLTNNLKVLIEKLQTAAIPVQILNPMNTEQDSNQDFDSSDAGAGLGQTFGVGVGEE